MAATLSVILGAPRTETFGCGGIGRRQMGLENVIGLKSRPRISACGARPAEQRNAVHSRNRRTAVRAHDLASHRRRGIRSDTSARRSLFGQVYRATPVQGGVA
jgi:hypothetical protein